MLLVESRDKVWQRVPGHRASNRECPTTPDVSVEPETWYGKQMTVGRTQMLLRVSTGDRDTVLKSLIVLGTRISSFQLGGIHYRPADRGGFLSHTETVLWTWTADVEGGCSG